MAVIKSLQARFGGPPEVLGDLRRHHRIFNERVRLLVPIIMKARRGDLGRDFQVLLCGVSHKKLRSGMRVKIMDGPNLGRDGIVPEKPKRVKTSWPHYDARTEEVVVLSDQSLVVIQRKHLLIDCGVGVNDFVKRWEAITGDDDWKGGDAQKSWPIEARNAARRIISAKLQPYRRGDFFAGVPSTFSRRVTEIAWQFVSSYVRGLDRWAEQHVIWRKERQQWETDNPNYMRVHAILDEFDSLHGHGRPHRTSGWRAKMLFYGARPELCNWRKQDVSVAPLTPLELKSNVKRQIKSITKSFWGRNPELAALAKAHDEYRSLFTRPWADRKNEDGFKLQPSFSLPKDNQWYVFRRGDEWRGLNLHASPPTVELRLIGVDGKPKWTEIRLRIDDRAGRLRHGELPGRSAPFSDGERIGACILRDPILQRLGEPPMDSQVLLKGIKMQGDHFVLSMELCDVPKTPVLKYDVSGIRTQQGWTDDYITLTVDLGRRWPGVMSAARRMHGKTDFVRLYRSVDAKPTFDGFIRPSGYSNVHVHHRVLKATKHQRLNDGQSYEAEFQRHIQHQKDDTHNKVASGVVECAVATSVRYGAKVIIVLEGLKGLQAKFSHSKTHNRMATEWAVAHQQDLIESLAMAYAIPVIRCRPSYTSCFCTKCFGPGARVRLPRKHEWKHFAEKYGHVRRMVIEGEGEFFVCPACQRMVQSDLEASKMMHLVVRGEFDPFKQKYDRVATQALVMAYLIKRDPLIPMMPLYNEVVKDSMETCNSGSPDSSPTGPAYMTGF